MKRLELTLEDPAWNLALDEALLDVAEAGPGPSEWLRLWEPAAPLVVSGRSTELTREVQLDACRREEVPVFQRCSGGASIVSGPGCLMYSLVLSLESHPHLAIPSEAHQMVLQRLAKGLQGLGVDASLAGTSDLALEGRKFSGNSLRAKRRHILYHGTLLYNFPLDLIERLLRMPPRQPDYRAQRTHIDFLINLPIQRRMLADMLVQQWNANEIHTEWPERETAELVKRRYRDATLNNGAHR